MNNEALQNIWREQYELNKRCGRDSREEVKSDQDYTKWVKDYGLALQQELAELIEHLPWKG